MDEKLDELINSLLDAYRAYLEAHRSEDGVQRRDRATTAADAIRALFNAQAAALAAAEQRARELEAREQGVPVNQELPEEGQAVLVNHGGVVEKAYFHWWRAAGQVGVYPHFCADEEDTVDAYEEYVGVTRWWPLPQPPEAS